MALDRFVDNPNKLAPLHKPTCFPGTRTFSGELRAAFVDNRTDSVLEFVEVLKKPISYTSTKSFLTSEMVFSCMCLQRYNLKNRKRAGKAQSEGL